MMRKHCILRLFIKQRNIKCANAAFPTALFLKCGIADQKGKKDVFKIGQVIQEEIKKRISDQNEIVSKEKMDRIDRN